MSTSTRCLRSGGRTDTARCEFAPFPSAKKNKRKNTFNQDLALAVSYQISIPLTWAAFPWCYDLRNHCLKVHTFTSQQCVQGGCAHNIIIIFFNPHDHSGVLQRGRLSLSTDTMKTHAGTALIDGIVLPSPVWRTLQSQNTTTWCSPFHDNSDWWVSSTSYNFLLWCVFCYWPLTEHQMGFHCIDTGWKSPPSPLNFREILHCFVHKVDQNWPQLQYTGDRQHVAFFRFWPNL